VSGNAFGEYACAVVTVGIVSPGAMGSAVGNVLAGGGARVMATVVGRSARTAQLAEGLELLADLDAVVRASEIVLSIVPPGLAVEVARDIASASRRVDADPVVLEDLRRNYPGLVDDAPRILQSIASKSSRYVAEMQEIAMNQQRTGLTPDLFTALATVFSQLSETEAARQAPEQVDAGARLEDVLAMIDGS
jgi:hypothetical protein